MPSVIDSPRPVPTPALVVENGSKILSICSLGIPTPSSAIATETREVPFPRDLDSDAAPVRYGSKSVVQNIEKDLLQLSAITRDGRNIGIELKTHRNVSILGLLSRKLRTSLSRLSRSMVSV